MSTKTKLLIAVAVIAVVSIVFAVVYKKGTTQLNCDNPAFEKYISAYTRGVISKTASIKIRLTDEVISKIDTTAELSADLFSFSPQIKGSVVFIGANTIEFKSDENLPSGTIYIAEFKLGKLVKVSSDLETFQFSFETIKQNIEVAIDEHITTDKKTFQWQKTLGFIHTADFENEDAIKSILKAFQGEKELPITIKSESDGRKHLFEIDSIARGDKASEIVLKWNGKAIGVDKDGELKIAVAALNDFSYLFYKIVQQPEQYIQLQFSDPIMENQELDGLIRISDQLNLRFIVQDNVIKVYPDTRLSGTYKVSIEEGIKNVLGSKFSKPISFDAFFEEIKPAVRFVSKGVILPNSASGLILPFEAVNLNAVDVRIVKIFENNITQFLQINDYEGDYELRRVGEVVLKKTIRLDQFDVVDFAKWNRFSLDLNKLIKTDPGAIYRVTIGFRKKYSLFNCDSDTTVSKTKDIDDSFGELQDGEGESSNWDYYDDYYYGEYDWENRDNPCYDAYYGARRAVSKNIIATDLGLIAKEGNDSSLCIFTTDIITAQPKQNVEVEVLNYQQQILAKGKSDKDGKIVFTSIKDAFFVIAKFEKQRAYMKIEDGGSLSLSRYDVSGVSVTNGLKGFIYGERGVWRPGDSLYLTFILEENGKPLPENHPIVFELKNPQDQLVKRLVKKKSSTGFYAFYFKTEPDAITGNWSASVKVGGAVFQKTIKIETIKPNRLKINIDFKRKYLMVNSAYEAIMNVKWLHGAVAKNLDAKVDVILSASKIYFEKYKDFDFDDPTKNFYAEQSTIFDKSIDENGNASVNADITATESAPGQLKATFVTKVFEKGGDFSIDQFSLPYHPFESYIGIRLPKGDAARGMLLTDTSHAIDLVTLDVNGNIEKKPHQIEMEFYKIEWKWWWDKTENDLSTYNSSSYVQPLKKETIMSVNGRAKWKIKVNYPDWGRYLLKARDLTSGHSTAKVVYIDWPGWASRAQKDNPDGATMLSFSSDKEKYNVNEKVTLTIPTGEKGRALISIESGSKVVESYWVETQKGQTKFSFTATKAMSPNVYVNVTLLQPHAQTINDLPIRLYGIVPISVEDPQTHLEPILEMPEVLESEKSVKVKVKEKNGKNMTYTIAMVDEGLLDLTRFATPNPWMEFYAKEALGVKTWDIFDWVIGAFSGQLERLLSIGGDGDLKKDAGKKANRFKPMVKFLGPFYLKGGAQAVHTIQIPKYIGSVRTMVIAGYDKAYGAAEKTNPVRKPLMILGTLPRVLGPGERVKLPVTVFAMEKNIKNVSIIVKNNNILNINGSNQRTLTFNQVGEQTIDFDLIAQPRIGFGKVEIVATSGKEKATFEIDIDVRNPNPKVTSVIEQTIDAGKSCKQSFKPIGIAGTNKVTLEVSSVPPLNLGKRLKYLIAYPHGCVEQTTSSVFPQLYLSDLMQLDNVKKNDITRNIKAGIQRLMSFQLSNGGLSYWPGNSDADQWGTSYAGHFMIEAEKKGYAVSEGFMKRWRSYQKSKANNWTDDGPSSQLIQAYRLYTLALCNKAEMGAMNRLKEKSNISNEAKWRLAAAYLIAGKKNIAEKMIQGLSMQVNSYNQMYGTYGSGVRDKAMILEMLSLLGKQKQALAMAKDLSKNLCSEEWFSTQTTAYSLIAMSKFLGKGITSKQLKYSYQINAEKAIFVTTPNTISQIDIPVKSLSNNLINIVNSSGGLLYARIIMEGIPPVGDQTDDNNNLQLSVIYKTTDGKEIDPVSLEQGIDFIAEVEITNPSFIDDYRQMALTQIFPSGWEIINSRMIESGSAVESSVPTYQDIRDDRVYTYFDLDKGKTKIFRILLNASYVGKYYLPTVSCEAMYDASISSRKAGMWINVVNVGN